jgi:hypothetical protein
MNRDCNGLTALFPVQGLFIRQQQEQEIARDACHNAGGNKLGTSIAFPIYVTRWMKFYPMRVVM